jgi:hypothetical protein
MSRCNLVNKRIGSKSDFLLKRNFFLSKYLTLNAFTIPFCKKLRILFPLFESEGLLRSKSIIIILEFLEQISGTRSIITHANLIVESGLWVKGQVNLSGLNFNKFFLFFNEYLLSHPLVRFSTRLPFLRALGKNYVKLIFSDIDFFFEASTKRILPHSTSYWLEFDFYFNNTSYLNKTSSVVFYTQYFFSNTILECRNR